MILFGLFLLGVGGGLTLWSWACRDPATGAFLIFPKLILSGIGLTFFGVVYWRLAR